MTALTDGERETLLTPCGCGHSINDHGTVCWVCAEGDDLGARVPCVLGFEELLVERLDGIVAGRAKARLMGVEALADEWERELDSGAIRDKDARYCWGLATRELRAALADAGVGDGGGGETSA